jgi:glycosyltransferase involved in cell wall biosynthesis
LTIIRSRIANRVIYQSQFAQTWWERVHGPTKTPAQVVHNGVDLDEFHPEGSGQHPTDRQRILLVEGALGGGYEMGLEHAVQLSNQLARKVEPPVELVVVGRVSPEVRKRAEGWTKANLRWAGVMPRECIPEIDRAAHVLFSADLNPACPNAVIEALACGLPVVGFETGALPELVVGDAGRLVDYGGDPWRLDPPDMEGLAKAVGEVLANQTQFRSGARAHAERALGLERMVDGYLDALGWR